MGDRLDERDEQAKQPDIRLLLRMTSPQQQQQDDQYRQCGKIGYEGKVHLAPCDGTPLIPGEDYARVECAG
jgi:hypothetical protein